MDSRRNPNHPAPTKFLSDRLWNANLRTLDADLRYAELPCLYWAKEPAFYSTIKNRHHSENLGHAEDSILLEPQQGQENEHSTPSRNPFCDLERDTVGASRTNVAFSSSTFRKAPVSSLMRMMFEPHIPITLPILARGKGISLLNGESPAPPPRAARSASLLRASSKEAAVDAVMMIFCSRCSRRGLD